FLFVGRTDPASAQIAPMASALRAQGAVVRYAIYPGGHDWELWNQHLDQMLIMAWHDVTTRFPHAHRARPSARRAERRRAARRRLARRATRSRERRRRR